MGAGGTGLHRVWGSKPNALALHTQKHDCFPETSMTTAADRYKTTAQAHRSGVHRRRSAAVGGNRWQLVASARPLLTAADQR